MVFQALFDEYFAGIVSDGTCNSEHLMPIFQDVLFKLYDMNALGTREEDKQLSSIHPCDYPNAWEDFSDFCNDLIDRLDAIAGNYGYTFSAHPDDGACFGFWKLDD
jgi:hypothetical protein